MNRKTLLFAALFAGIISLYSCNNPDSNRDRDTDDPYERTPIPADTLLRDTVPGDTLAPVPQTAPRP